ncbi:hypothetical protein DYB32_005502 [Aphanomyces invadans]|uniref:VPS9 domain-containing protein n=1 Tax=Aphanomyces invadans TaxID=157072 RepID=A0A418AUE7_9STRA|nr:hypothetical protein DYB32_005502 [Aphanomyces invadans]
MPNYSYVDNVFRTTMGSDEPWCRMSVADVDSVRSSRSLLQVGPIFSDMAHWKERANESMRVASRRTIHLLESLEMNPVERKATQRATSATFIQEVDAEHLPLDDHDRDSATVPVVSHSGWLIKQANRTRSFKRRLFFILGQELVYHKSHESSYAISGKVNLSLEGTAVARVPNFGFKLLQGSSTMLLYALNDADRDGWIHKLNQCGVPTTMDPTSPSKTTASSLSTTEKRVVAAGWLRKQGQVFKSVKRRWFELTGAGGLSYYRNPESTKAKGLLEITMASTVTRLDMRKTGERFSFSITKNALDKKSRVLFVHADSEEDRSIWIAAVSSVIFGGVDDLPPTTLSSPLVSTDGSFLERSLSDEVSPVHSQTATDDVAPVRDDSDFLRDVAREAQLILISPYSPEGTTSENFLKTVHRKTLCLQSIRRFMEGLMEYMVTTRMHYFCALCGDTAVGTEEGLFDAIAAIISEQVEERVFSPIHKVVYQVLVPKAESRAMKDRLELLQGRKQAYFGINPQSPSGYAAAVEAMTAIDCQSLPSRKRKQLVVACKTIYAVAAAEGLYPAAAMSADDFIPAFIYVVVQCGVEDVLMLKELLVAFPPVSDTGETAYFVTCLEIAIEYVQSLVLLQELELDGDRPLGLEFAVVEPSVLVVTDVAPNSQAAVCGHIHTNDVLMTVNGNSVHDRSVADLAKVLQAAQGPVALAFVNMKDYKKVKASLATKS